MAQHGWAPLTARVAWTLLTEGVRIRPPVLRAARDHALLQLPPDTPLHHAEDQAELHTRRFVAAARRISPDERWPQDAVMPLSPRWRAVVLASLDATTATVYRLYYGDRRDVEQVAAALGEDALAVEAACGGLREVVRAAACRDGVPLDSWCNERVDRLLCRLAGLSTGPCPDLAQLIDGEASEHRPSCPRCDRTFRLIAAGVLSHEDLLPPALGARPRDEVQVAILHFHPGARRHWSLLASECPGQVFRLGEEQLLVEVPELEALQEVLEAAARVGAPRRSQLRGAVLRGAGRWTRFGLIGPLTSRVSAEVRTVPWGQVRLPGGSVEPDALLELPEELPPPPPARRAWMAVLGLAAIALLATLLALEDPTAAASSGLSVEFTPGRGGMWTEFDVEEVAPVALISHRAGRLEVVIDPADPSHKLIAATGDGRYRLHTPGQGVLLASSERIAPHLDELLAAASEEAQPLDALAGRIQHLDGAADVRVYRR